MTMSFRRFRHISFFVNLRSHIGYSFGCSPDPPFVHFNSTTNERERSGHQDSFIANGVALLR